MEGAERSHLGGAVSWLGLQRNIHPKGHTIHPRPERDATAQVVAQVNNAQFSLLRQFQLTWVIKDVMRGTLMFKDMEKR